MYTYSRIVCPTLSKIIKVMLYSSAIFILKVHFPFLCENAYTQVYYYRSDFLQFKEVRNMIVYVHILSIRVDILQVQEKNILLIERGMKRKPYKIFQDSFSIFFVVFLHIHM